MLSDKLKNRWSIKYAPKELSDCVFPESTRVFFENMIDSEYLPHLFLYGAPGTGKTTVSKILAEFCRMDPYVINASLDVGKETLRTTVSEYCSTVGLGGALDGTMGKAVLLDEADCMPRQSQEALRGLMDKFQENVSFILTGNYPDKLMEPIKTRCVCLDLGGSGNKEADTTLAKSITERVRWICEQEEVDFDEKIVNQIVVKDFPNIRQIIINAEMVLKMKLPVRMVA